MENPLFVVALVVFALALLGAAALRFGTDSRRPTVEARNW
jgi:hypothetical protein